MHKCENLSFFHFFPLLFIDSRVQSTTVYLKRFHAHKLDKHFQTYPFLRNEFERKCQIKNDKTKKKKMNVIRKTEFFV